MLNERRYEEVKNVFWKKEIDLNDSDIRLYADVFEIIAVHINNKLTTEEIMDVYDFLSDVILNKRPDIKIHVEKTERIRVQVELMDTIPFIGDRLTQNEKVMLAFCIYLGECVHVYDEKTDEEKNGVVLFTSVESISCEFERYKKINPGLFDLAVDNTANESRVDFGYDRSNPILAVSIRDAYKYLSRLEYKGKKVEYLRMGSTSGENGHILDAYRITVKDGILFFKGNKNYTIYIDSYASATSEKAPIPFDLR